MSASFFDLLKYRATGIPAPDMTAWDKARALAIGGGSKEQTLTGIPPLSFPSDGTPLISWSMKGNGQQTGTPSPQSIIMPTLCGVRTGNLADLYKANYYVKGDGTEAALNGFNLFSAKIEPSTTYALSATYQSGGGTTVRCCEYDASGAFISKLIERNLSALPVTFTTSQDAKIVKFSAAEQASSIMLNSGSTALPFEPFGYKIPLTNAGQTVPVYLGQVSTVRRIKKVAFTGNEIGWAFPSGTVPRARILLSDVASTEGGINQTPLSTHYIGRFSDNNGSVRILTDGKTLSFADATNAVDLSTWTTYLQQQYANGTPVTVWYVLATPTTGIVNEPLCKIGTYADELSSTDADVTIPTAKGQNTLTVDTPIQPSEMTITYRG